MPNLRSIITLLLLLLITTPICAVGDSETKSVRLNDSMLLNHLIETWQSMLTYECVPLEIKRGTANSMYGLLFQLWLMPSYRSSFFLSKSEVQMILTTTKQYVIRDDPLQIESYYDHGNLAGDGLIKEEFLLVNNVGSDIAKKQDYKRRVAGFLSWLDETMKEK